MRRGSLADSGTIICPLQEKTSWGALRGQNRAESTAQLHLSSLLDPGGNPVLLDSQEATSPLSAGSLGTEAQFPSTKLLIKQFVFLHKSPGVLNYILNL